MHPFIARLIERCRFALAGPGGVLAAEVSLVAAVAAVAAMLTWQLMPADGPRIDTRIPATTAVPVDSGDGSVEIASLHLFGVSAEDTGPQQESVPADAPETRLNLKLQGVYATGDGNGVAIIAVGNTQEAVFIVGDRVAGQARVNGIYSDRVILERDGSLETLRLATDEVATRAPGTVSKRAASGNRDIQRIARKAQELRTRLMRNPLELARMVRFQPYLRDGELIGYRIRPRAADAELLEQLGFKPTDVITAVNGVALTDPAKAQEVLRQVQSARTISISWLRDGRQHQVTIPIGAPS